MERGKAAVGARRVFRQNAQGLVLLWKSKVKKGPKVTNLFPA